MQFSLFILFTLALYSISVVHMRRARMRAGGLQYPPKLRKAIIFRAKGSSQKGKHFFCILLSKNGIHFVQRDEVPEMRDFY